VSAVVGTPLGSGGWATKATPSCTAARPSGTLTGHGTGDDRAGAAP